MWLPDLSVGESLLEEILAPRLLKNLNQILHVEKKRESERESIYFQYRQAYIRQQHW